MEDEAVSVGTPLPLFKVSVPEVIKKGENVLFTIKTTRVADQENFKVLRQHEDIEWLHHNLVTGNCTDGVIIPPLPIKPLSDPKSAESLSKKNLGDNTKVLRGDTFEVDCKSVQKYLEMMLSHTLFAKDSNLEKFLTEEEAAVRAKLSKGFMARLGSAFDSVKKGNTKLRMKLWDIDEFFSTQRNFANDYSKAVKDACNNYKHLNIAQWRLSSVYRQVAADLTNCTAEVRDDQIIKVNKIMKIISDGCEDEAGSLELRSGQGELTLGFYLDLLARHSESVKEMHGRRVNALVEFQNLEKSAEKAKLAKKAAAEDARDAAKSILEKSSEQAKKELTVFTQQRLLSSEEALSAYATLQMKISQDFYSQLFHTKKSILELKL